MCLPSIVRTMCVCEREHFILPRAFQLNWNNSFGCALKNYYSFQIEIHKQKKMNAKCPNSGNNKTANIHPFHHNMRPPNFTFFAIWSLAMFGI